MEAPIGNRKVTVISQGTSTIDGSVSKILQNPWESIMLVYNNNNWNKV